MNTPFILTFVALLLTMAAGWNFSVHGRMTPAARTWISVAGIYMFVSVLLWMLR
jgi:hypothetical protein